VIDALPTHGRPRRAFVDNAISSLQCAGPAKFKTGESHIEVRAGRMFRDGEEFMHVAPQPVQELRVPTGSFRSPRGHLHVEIAHLLALGMHFVMMRQCYPPTDPRDESARGFLSSAYDMWEGAAPFAPALVDDDGYSLSCSFGTVHFTDGVPNLAVLERPSGAMEVINFVDNQDVGDNEARLRGALLSPGVYVGSPPSKPRPRRHTVGEEDSKATMEEDSKAEVASLTMAVRIRSPSAVADAEWWNLDWSTPVAAVEGASVERMGKGAVTFAVPPASGPVPGTEDGDGNAMVILMAIGGHRVVWLENKEDSRVLCVLSSTSRQHSPPAHFAVGTFESNERDGSTCVMTIGRATGPGAFPVTVGGEAGVAQHVTGGAMRVPQLPGRLFCLFSGSEAPGRPDGFAYLCHEGSQTNGGWRGPEDDALKAGIAQHGENNWTLVAALLPNRTARQCKERWFQWLNPVNAVFTKVQVAPPPAVESSET